VINKKGDVHSFEMQVLAHKAEDMKAIDPALLSLATTTPRNETDWGEHDVIRLSGLMIDTYAEIN
jgi:hypothetical protein